MKKRADSNASLSQMLMRTSDLVFLNLLTLLCCLPVITVGAAITALYDTVARMQRGEGKLFSGFFKAFGANFLRATALWLLFLALAVPTVYYLLVGSVSLATAGLLAVILATAVLSWLFPMLTEYRAGVLRTLKPALRCVTAYLPRTAIMTVLNLLPLLLFLFMNMVFWRFAMIWLCIYFSLTAWFNQGLIHKLLWEMDLD